MSAVILDYRADKEILFNIDKLGIDVIPSFQSLRVSKELAGHPDLQICKISDRIYVCSPESYEYYKKVLAKYKIRLICGDLHLGSNYPDDIAYNVARVGDIAIHNTLCTDSTIKKVLNDSGIDLIHTNQGYSKCNICSVSDCAVITSDVGIYSVLIAVGVDTLLIQKGHIDIFGWDYGFIGGATGKINDSTLVFCGNLSLHPDCEAIIDFCRKYGVDCISLSKKRLMDLGSVISVENYITV